jgi:hypothetical protein
LADNGGPTDGKDGFGSLGTLQRFIGWLTSLRTIVTVVLAFAGGLLTGVTAVVNNALELEQTALSRWPNLNYNLYESVGKNRALSVSVPREWDVSVNQELTLGSKVVGPAILASQTDTVKWWTSYETSGLFLAASNNKTVLGSEPEAIMEQATNASEACETEILTRTQEERRYIISYRVWDKCGNTDSQLLAFVARHVNKEHVVVGIMTINDDGDWEARREIFTSFNVNEKLLSKWKPMSLG